METLPLLIWKNSYKPDMVWVFFFFYVNKNVYYVFRNNFLRNIIKSVQEKLWHKTV